MGSKNPCQPLSQELSNPAACSHTNEYLGRHPDFTLISD
ncbi:hypothetical protein MXB_3650 [Myxobolus squamalis]|nr:hypothetical protein MXB_3650 [Myxobolus squamalis]